MRKLSDWIQKVSTGKVVLVTLVIFIAFTALVLPDQAAQAEQYSEGVGSVDTSFVYSPDDIYRIAQGLGEEGRDAYVRARWTFDLVWPIVYAVFLAVAVSYLLDKAFSHQGDWHMLNLVPVFGMIFDYLENLAATGVMLAFPDKLSWLNVLAAGFTPIKWVFVGDGFALALIGLVAWGVNSLKQSRQTKTAG